MKPGCVITAGGAGRRMGGQNKALLPYGGTSFLESIHSSLLEMFVAEAPIAEVVVVVAEPYGAETSELAASLGITALHNAHPEMGMASSVAMGFEHALREFSADACWLWPVDAPGVRASTLQALLAHARGDAIVTPSYGGRGGHPSLVGRELWAELAACTNEPEGARTVFRRSAERRVFVEVDDKAVSHDVDRPADLEVLS